jgi:hypothetical protein
MEGGDGVIGLPSSPSVNDTNSLSGLARRQNCASRRWRCSSTGPKPTEKPLTRMPCQVAAKK